MGHRSVRTRYGEIKGGQRGEEEPVKSLIGKLRPSQAREGSHGLRTTDGDANAFWGRNI